MTIRSRALHVVIATGLALSLGAAALPAQAAVASLAEASPRATRDLAFSMTLDSVDRYEQTMGADQYGVNILEGTTRIGGTRVSVQRISVTQYVDGNGPISGFLTLTWPDGDRAGFSVSGQSELIGARTHVYGTLRLIAGTGRWRDYAGIGVMTGLRRGPIGSPVRYRVDLSLTK